MILLKDVTKVFKQKNKTIYACNDINLAIESNQIFGLIGPNGAGKTTTLRLISTLMAPTKGKIDVNGHDTIKEQDTIRAQIGFLSSDMTLPSNYTPRELLLFFGRLNNLKNEILSKRISEIVEQLNLSQYIDVLTQKLSTGNKQKTLIAISIIHNPEIVIFDEPTNGLDLFAAQSVLKIIKKMRDDGKTVILSTHNLAIAERTCNNIAFINKGKIVETNDVQSLKKKYDKSLEDIYLDII
ncbi:MAG: ATP-binding cassette domain-containing protein [Proteobacteria bacterium]|nr:ATP-binding cassette domain-containing protein [Pseudomonadota bacterium]